MGEEAGQLLEHLEASVSGCSIVDEINMCAEVLIELLHLEVVVAKVIGVQLDPVVPVQLPNSHSDMIRTMSHGSVQLRVCCIQVELLQGNWQRRLKQ